MLKIRLRRMGTRNAPFYRVVVSDRRKVPTASAIEELGYYDPRRNPSVVAIDRDRVEFWTGRGARLSKTVETLLTRPNTVVEAEAATPPPAESS